MKVKKSFISTRNEKKPDAKKNQKTKTYTSSLRCFRYKRYEVHPKKIKIKPK
ncbi:MAG: hypothetical protein NTW30_01190 [Candidatus Aenigmarchaeota archaeon]|nr:hypothetical protein [Candidatus Aenigmarchaeota archaeon]